MPNGPVDRPERRTFSIPRNLVPSLAAALRATGRLSEDPLVGNQALNARLDGTNRIELREDGTGFYPMAPAIRALLVQSIKGILPLPLKRFSCGIDEAGVGGEAKQPYVAIVVIPTEIEAELIAEGIRDSKRIGSSEELSRLGEIIRSSAIAVDVLPLRALSPHAPFASVSARAAGTWLQKALLAGVLPGDLEIRCDQMDRPALLDATGDFADTVEANLVMEPRAERHVSVACASILATLAARESGRAFELPKTSKAEIGHFSIGSHRKEDRDQVLGYLKELENAYPDIGKWIGETGQATSVWDRIEAGRYHLTVARLGERVAGFCITQQKDARNAKISTFYVAKPFRGRHIGPGILQRELYRLARGNVRRVMVTFAHEEFQEMQPFLTLYGFQVDGISPQRYRENSYEVVMGKRFKHGLLKLEDFGKFVRHDMFHLLGYDVDDLGGELFLATPRQDIFALHKLPVRRQYLIQATVSKQPEEELGHVKAKAKERDAQAILVSAYGYPADTPLPSDALVLDAYSIETQFYPLHLERPNDKDLILPITPEFAARLLPSRSQTTLKPVSLGLRMECTYYRAPKSLGKLRRGARVFFYESKGRGIFGSARLKSIQVASPKKLFAQFGGRGTFSLAEIEASARNGRAQAISFDWFEEYRRPIPLEEIREVEAKFNPITGFRLSQAQGFQLHSRGLGQ